MEFFRESRERTNCFAIFAKELVVSRVSRKNCQQTDVSGASWLLVDRGANGGVAGSDTRIISQTGRTVIITSIDDHQLDNIPIGTCGAVVPTNKGNVIVILHERICAVWEQRTDDAPAVRSALSKCLSLGQV